ncbi:putative Cyclin-dependent kinase [Planktothrix serta PCC 8927]|uniref:non-specific serine/threonine protein kinase n=1 Tax=Planktothrix serta PCC 8927 TaxID=671068 RepID=A0A7Z9BHD9_9CYAN|nr:serine/threonine-protein kinase [Planktothrix serta]VXD11253.1 putative Cyclin-dependent kinase [Planktothrix serta PCC 8927]
MSAQLFGNRWKNIRQIGEGGQSNVFLVEDLNREFSDTCVLKRLKNKKRLDRFKQEIKAGRKLDHPQIAPILDFSLDKEPYYFVTKKYPDSTLSKFASAPLEPVQALTIFIEICDVVAYAHSKGIVHRDLKPDNIILDENQKPVILDFGICYFEDEDNRLTGTEEQVGSRYFIAPESEGGRSLDVTWAVDSYSLGKILYFLLSSKLFPREAYTGSDSLSKLLNDPQLDYITERILDKSVVEDFNKRSSVSELQKEAETVKRLIHEHFYPGKAGSRCRFCGEGTYQPNNYAGLKVYTRVQNTPNMSSPNEFFMECESIICDVCSNIQWFSKPMESKFNPLYNE